MYLVIDLIVRAMLDVYTINFPKSLNPMTYHIFPHFFARNDLPYYHTYICKYDNDLIYWLQKKKINK